MQHQLGGACTWALGCFYPVNFNFCLFLLQHPQSPAHAWADASGGCTVNVWSEMAENAKKCGLDAVVASPLCCQHPFCPAWSMLFAVNFSFFTIMGQSCWFSKACVCGRGVVQTLVIAQFWTADMLNVWQACTMLTFGHIMPCAMCEPSALFSVLSGPVMLSCWFSQSFPPYSITLPCTSLLW